MGILIDSSVFIDAERGRLSLAGYLTNQEHEPVRRPACTRASGRNCSAAGKVWARTI